MTSSLWKLLTTNTSAMHIYLDKLSDMLPGLLMGQEKMSKSDPNSAIFMEDEEVRHLFRYMHCNG